jgi:hypothetical protein
MRLPDLQRILIDGARRQEHAAGVARGARARGRKVLAIALAAILIAGTAAGAVITLSRSKPLSGTLAEGPARLGPSHYRIGVFPYMSVGWSGWCARAVFESRTHREATDYGCSPVESSGPVVAGVDTFGDQNGEYSYGVVSDQVASVHWRGAIVVPIASSHLPPGTRAYFIAAPVRSSVRPPLPTLFDREGRLIEQTAYSHQSAVEHLPVLAVNPRDPGTAACGVRVVSDPKLTPVAETVTTPVPWPRRQRGAFLACANATYRLAGTRLALAVLLDASDARRLAPPLPELAPDPAHPELLTGSELGTIGFPSGAGVFDGAGRTAFTARIGRHQDQFDDNDVSARRAGRAWLVAEGGTAAQRAALLAHVTLGPSRRAR